MGLVYLPTFGCFNGKCIGEYASPMDPSWDPSISTIYSMQISTQTIRLNNIAVKHLALSLSTQQSTHMSHVWLDQSLRVFISFQDIPIQESAVTLCET